MTPPEVACARFLCCAGAGFLLGPASELFRCPGRRFPLLFQFLVSGELTVVWLFCAFAICSGDIRPGYIAGIPAGYLAWKYTLGTGFSRLMGRFWSPIFRFGQRISASLQKIFKKTRKNEKFYFATGEKSVTIN